MRLKYANLKKASFKGFFWGIDADDSLIELLYSTLTELEPDNNIGTPLIGFDPSNPKEYFYDADRHLSVEFSQMDTSDKLVKFVEKYGSLFGTTSQLSQALDKVTPVNDECIKAFFHYAFGGPLGEVRLSKLRETGYFAAICDNKARLEAADSGGVGENASNSSEGLLYEPLDAWISSIRQMGAAYSLAFLLKRGFSLTELKGDDGDYANFNEKDNPSVLNKKFELKDGNNRNSWQLCCCYGSSPDEEKVITLTWEGVGDKQKFLKRIWKPHNWEPVETDIYGKRVRVDFKTAGDGRMRIVINGSNLNLATKSVSEEDIREFLAAALRGLIFFNRPSALFGMDEDGITYEFSSLNSYLWFDLICVIAHKRGFSLCERCGRPILLGNQGMPKRFCGDKCRKQSNREAREARQ